VPEQHLHLAGRAIVTAVSPLRHNVLLAAKDISKAFAGVRVLDGVGLDVRSGEVHALVGENGAGKTTLLMILAGVIAQDGGTIEIRGEAVQLANASDAQAAGVGTVFQELSLVSRLSVAENIWANRVPVRGRFGIVDRKRMAAGARMLLGQLQCDIKPSVLVGSLGMGARQLVEIAKALSVDAQVLILDEPTTSLNPGETRVLFQTLRRLAERGLGIVFVSHRLGEVFELADRISVLRDGQLRATVTARETTPQEVVAAMVGRPLSSLFPPRAASIGASRLRLARCRGMGIGPIDLDVRAGEILALAGLRGAGRTRLAELITGVGRLDAGEIAVDGRRVRIRQPRDAIDAGIAYLPADRARDGLFPRMSLAANICASDLASASRVGIMRSTAELKLALHFQQALRIRARNLRQPINRLSGGNQQKVLLAKCLVRSPKVLIADEPTQGVDIGTKADVHQLLRELAIAGRAVLMISSDLTEVLGMADRIAVMAQGRVEAVIDGARATEDAIMHAAAGADPEIEA
jgi:ABC-type sugar transport system ATPase subunit